MRWEEVWSYWNLLGELHGAERVQLPGGDIIRDCVLSHDTIIIQFRAGVSWHPSHPALSSLLAEEEKDLLGAVKCPQLMMPAGADAPSTKAGGLAGSVLGELLEIEEFPEMQHGWTVRGGE